MVENTEGALFWEILGFVPTPPRPSFSLAKDIEQQSSFFWEEKQVTPEIAKLFASVGRIKFGKYNETGTCFALRRTEGVVIMTALHCLSLKFMGEIMNGSAVFSDLDVPFGPKDIQVFEDKDIAVITPQARIDIEPLEIGNPNVAVGETVMIIGFPDAYINHRYIQKPVLSIGRIAQLDKDRSLMESIIRSEKGNSGSPLMTTDGKVIGIINQGLMVSNDFIANNRAKREFRENAKSRATCLPCG